MKTALALLALAISAQGHPMQRELTQEQFCAQLRKVLSYAEDGAPFTELERAHARPPTLGFFPSCRASGTGANTWFCHQSLAPGYLHLGPLAERTAACLPDAIRSDRRHLSEVQFTLPYARILISEHGGPRAHVGTIMSYYGTATPRAK